jgi:hypothetical protein
MEAQPPSETLFLIDNMINNARNNNQTNHCNVPPSEPSGPWKLGLVKETDYKHKLPTMSAQTIVHESTIKNMEN